MGPARYLVFYLACGFLASVTHAVVNPTSTEAALGASFDLRAFHDELLRDGALPLTVLEAKMERWMRR